MPNYKTPLHFATDDCISNFLHHSKDAYPFGHAMNCQINDSCRTTNRFAYQYLTQYPSTRCRPVTSEFHSLAASVLLRDVQHGLPKVRFRATTSTRNKPSRNEIAEETLVHKIPRLFACKPTAESFAIIPHTQRDLCRFGPRTGGTAESNARWT